MTRLPVLLCACLIALAYVPAVALSQPATHRVDAAAVAHLLAPRQAQPAIPSIARARMRAGAGASIHGTITDAYGFGMPSARISWLAPGGSPSKGSTPTDADGAYAFSAVPAAGGDGELGAVSEPDNGVWERGRYGMTWADGGDLTLDLRAGVVSAGVYRGGPWYAWKNVVLLVWTTPADGNGTCYTMETARNSDFTGEGLSTDLSVEAGTGDGAAVYFWSNEGVEVPFTADVQPGSPSTPSLAAYEDGASRLRMTEPSWMSGRPGKAAILNLSGFDIGWVNQISGQSDYPGGGAWKNITRMTMKESEANLKVAIPSTAKPGYFYWISADHMNGMAALSLRVPYQVATLKPSSTSVARGGTVRLTGVVPVDGHWGARRGAPKTVTLYRGPNSQPQPRTWEPSRNDYAKVGTFRTDGYGRFRTSAVRVNGTTTFIVRYPGDATYWRAYTTPVLVKVK